MNNKISRNVLVIFMFITSILYSKDNFYWGSIGIGSSNYAFTSGKDPNLNLGLKLTYQFNRYLASVSSKAIFEPWLPEAPTPYEMNTNIGFLISKFYKNEEILVSSGIGPSYFFIAKRGKLIEDNWPGSSKHELISNSYLGLTLNLDLFLHGSDFGLGFNFSYNYFRYSYFDFLVSFNFGKISNLKTKTNESN